MRTDRATGSGLTASGTDYASVVATGVAVKSSPGRVCRILVVAGTGSLDVYDGTTSGGTHLYSKAAVAVGDTYALDCPTNTGIYVATGAGTTVTVIYS